jgi:hypothetical protein
MSLDPSLRAKAIMVTERWGEDPGVRSTVPKLSETSEVGEVMGIAFVRRV